MATFAQPLPSLMLENVSIVISFNDVLKTPKAQKAIKYLLSTDIQKFKELGLTDEVSISRFLVPVFLLCIFISC